VPAHDKPLAELHPALREALVDRPSFLVQIELYEDHLLLRTSPTALRVFVGRVKQRFSYDGACVHCQILRILADIEATGVDGAQGVTDNYRQRVAIGPKFVAVFRPRIPAAWWSWGWDAAAAIVPTGLCSRHSSTPSA
jgi:hypothetical protein